jgi:hypothetical protein
VLTVTIGSTTLTLPAVVVEDTFNVYSDPCDFLLNNLAEQIKVDMSVPLSSTLTCAVVSVTTLSDGRRSYRWDVIATWTE